MISALAQSVARHVLTGIGATLVSAGYMNADEASAIIGGLIAAGAVIWSQIDKVRSAG